MVITLAVVTALVVVPRWWSSRSRSHDANRRLVRRVADEALRSPESRADLM
jgi:hypothetical protein